MVNPPRTDFLHLETATKPVPRFLLFLILFFLYSLFSGGFGGAERVILWEIGRTLGHGSAFGKCHHGLFGSLSFTQRICTRERPAIGIPAQ